MQKKMLNFRALTFLALVLMLASTYQARAQAENARIRLWLHSIGI